MYMGGGMLTEEGVLACYWLFLKEDQTGVGGATAASQGVVALSASHPH